MKTVLIFIGCVFILCQCTTQYKSRRINKLIKDIPVAVVDSILTVDSVEKTDSISIFYDANTELAVQNLIDSLYYELSIKCPLVIDTSNIQSTVLKKKVQKKFKKINLSYFIKDTIRYDSIGIGVKIYAVGDMLKVNIDKTCNDVVVVKTKKILIPCPDDGVTFWEALKTLWWLLIIFMLVIIFLLILVIVMK